jgi:hypothetical protein
MICMRNAKTAKTVTPRKYAEMHEVAYTTVMKWLQNDLIPGAVKAQLPAPFVGHTYQVPEDAPPPALKPGPKPKASKNGKPKANGAGKKKR